MKTYTNKKGIEILVDESGWKISRANYEKKVTELANAQKNRKAPQSLLNELKSAEADGESAEYIEYLKAKIARYA